MFSLRSRMLTNTCCSRKKMPSMIRVAPTSATSR
ncbi:Uncharacterised protein [Bordetella pertussis]|nr:Uncharacterised protein [Bordetella pertussis]